MLDIFIIEGIKNALFNIPGLKGANDLFGQNLGLSMLPMFALLFIGKIVVIYIKSDRFQEKFKKSKHKDLIANTLAAVGIITMIIILS